VAVSTEAAISKKDANKIRRKAEKSKKRLTEISIGWNAVFLLILTVGVLLTVLPVAIIVIVSFSSKESIAYAGYSFFPTGWSTEGYAIMFKMGRQLVQSYFVSIGYSVSGTAVSLLIMSLYAYVLLQKKFIPRKFLTWFMFFTMIFNGGLVPSYILHTRYLHLNDTFLLFVVSNAAACYSIIILRTFMKTTVPDSLIESACIDGAGHFRIYLTIVMPLLKAGLATMGLFAFVMRWNDWFLAFFYNTDQNLIPLQTLLYRMIKKVEYFTNGDPMSNTPEMQLILRNLPKANLRMAVTVMVVVPIIFAYPFFQRYFEKGMLVGSLKE